MYDIVSYFALVNTIVGAVPSTETIAVPVTELFFPVAAVIVTVPSASPVTTPFWSTVAIVGSELDHVTVLFVVVPSGVIVACNVVVFLPATIPTPDSDGVTVMAVGVFMIVTVICFVIESPFMSV